MSASDELRAMAESVGMEIPQVATLMMGAADSIEGLDAENKMLRELANIGEYAAKECSELAEQNTKLRELVQYICDECYGDDWFIEEAAALGIEGRY